MKFPWKNLNALLLFLFFLSCCIFIGFSVNRVYRFSVAEPAEENPSSLHVLVGAEDSEPEFMHRFFLGVDSVCSRNDAVAELLQPPVGTEFCTLDEWCSYAEFVCADILILYSENSAYKVRPLYDVHGKFIPVIIAGQSDPLGAQVCRITNDVKGEAEAAVREMIAGNYRNPAVFRGKSSCAAEYDRLISIAEKEFARLSGASAEFESHGLSYTVIDDEVRQLLPNLVRNDGTDIVLCYSADEINVVAQIIVDLNLTDKVSVMGFYANAKTEEFLYKGIVYCVVGVEPQEMGRNAVEEFFTWRKTGSARREIPAAVKIIRGKRQ